MGRLPSGRGVRGVRSEDGKRETCGIPRGRRTRRGLSFLARGNRGKTDRAARRLEKPITTSLPFGCARYILLSRCVRRISDQAKPDEDLVKVTSRATPIYYYFAQL